MKVFVQVILLSILFGFCSVTAIADDQTPAEEDVCADLQLPGVTPGLYGLCDAYCEAQDCDEGGLQIEDQPRSCQRLYFNFMNKATGPLDPVPPVPPCVDSGPDPEIPPPCACWPDVDQDGFPVSLLPENLHLGPNTSGECLYDGESSFSVTFTDNVTTGQAVFIVSPWPTDPTQGACNYFYITPMEFDMEEEAPLGMGEFDDCVAGVVYLRETYEGYFSDEDSCAVLLEPDAP